LTNPYAALVGNAKPKNSEKIGGNFLCERPVDSLGRPCWESANEAVYYPDDKILVFVCPKGHTTTLEKFRL